MNYNQFYFFLLIKFLLNLEIIKFKSSFVFNEFYINKFNKRRLFIIIFFNTLNILRKKINTYTCSPLTAISMAIKESTELQSSDFECGPDHLPLVLLHRIPSFDTPFTSLLQTHFRVLDPHSSSQPFHAFVSGHHAQSVRVVVVEDLTTLTADTIRLLPSLELVVGTSAGIDHIDISECRSRGITVTNAGDSFSEDVADCAVALLIGVLRWVSAADLLRGDYPLGSKVHFC